MRDLENKTGFRVTMTRKTPVYIYTYFASDYHRTKLVDYISTLSALDKIPQQENLRPKTSVLSIFSPHFSLITYDSLFRPKRIDGGCQLDQLCSARRCCSRKVRVLGYFLRGVDFDESTMHTGLASFSPFF